MAKINVLSMSGRAVEEISVSDSVFGAEKNLPLVHEVVIAQQNNLRQGTKSALTRTEVRGHAKKPWRQKGTGNARHGSSKAPSWVGGGIAFAPKPRDFSGKINKSKKIAAFKSAISGKLTDGELVCVKEISLKEQKTKEVAAMIEKLKLADKRVMLVVKEYDETILKCGRNIEKLNITTARQLSVLDIVNNKYCLLTQDAVKEIEEAYKD